MTLNESMTKTIHEFNLFQAVKKAENKLYKLKGITNVNYLTNTILIDRIIYSNEKTQLSFKLTLAEDFTVTLTSIIDSLHLNQPLNKRVIAQFLSSLLQLIIFFTKLEVLPKRPATINIDLSPTDYKTYREVILSLFNGWQYKYNQKQSVLEIYLQYDRWIQRWQVKGKSGNYVIAIDRDGQWGCSCPGWTKNKDRSFCKHIKYIKSQREKGVKLTGIIDLSQPRSPDGLTQTQLSF